MYIPWAAAMLGYHWSPVCFPLSVAFFELIGLQDISYYVLIGLEGIYSIVLLGLNIKLYTIRKELKQKFLDEAYSLILYPPPFIFNEFDFSLFSADSLVFRSFNGCGLMGSIFISSFTMAH